MPATQRKYIYKGLTLDVDRHYIGSVTATTHQEKGITLESEPSRGTVLPAQHGKGKKCDKNAKELMNCHCGTNNRAPQLTFTDPIEGLISFSWILYLDHYHVHDLRIRS